MDLEKIKALKRNNTISVDDVISFQKKQLNETIIKLGKKYEPSDDSQTLLEKSKCGLGGFCECEFYAVDTEGCNTCVGALFGSD